MESLFSDEMNNAIRRAKNELQSISSSQLAELGLNRYRVSDNEPPFLAIPKDGDTTEDAYSSDEE